MLEDQGRILSGQADTAKKLSASLGNPKTTRNTRNMTSAMKANNEALDQSVDKAKELEDALSEAADAAEDSSDGFSMLGSAFSGLGSILSGGLGVLKSVGGAILNIGASLLKTAFSIFTFPFKLFGSLVEMAQQGGGGRPMAEAWQEVVETFGDLATGPGKALEQTFYKVKKSAHSLAGTGVSVRDIFGYGREGMAAMLKDLNELAGAMGDNFHRLQSQFKSLGDKSIVFQRGLGLSKEEFGELAGIAESRGQNVEKFLTKFSKSAVQTAKRFGIGVKDMAKGMKELNLDVENFGHLGPKAFAPITAYARKLGLEIKDMAGIMAKFSGFADTAESASKMQQQFGMNVDAMQLMAAQNPAEKIDILRKAFFRTGKDLKDFNYQQRQYLASVTGIEGKSLDAAFSLSKQGISYANIAKEAKKAEKKQLSQKQVLKELSKGIKKLIQTMSGPKVTGFFDSFVKGFETGIMRSKEFRGVLINIKSGLRIMRQFGIRIGRLFVKIFPGIKDMLDGLSEFLNPSKFNAVTKAIEPLFKAFFSGEKTFSQLMDSIQKGLNDNFGVESSGIGKIGKGFMKFVKRTSEILGEILTYVFDKIRTKFIPFMDEVLTDAEAYAASTGSSKIGAIFKVLGDKIGETKFGAVIMDALGPLLKVFAADGSFMKLVEAAAPVFKKLFTMIADDVFALGKLIGRGIYCGLTDFWSGLSFWEKSGMIGGAALLLAPGTTMKLGYQLVKGTAKGLWKGGSAAVNALTKSRGAAGQGFMSRLWFGNDKAKALKLAEKASKAHAAKMSKAAFQGAGGKGGGKAATEAAKKAFQSSLNNQMRGNTKAIEAGTSRFLKSSGGKMGKAVEMAGKAGKPIAQAATKIFPTFVKAATSPAALGGLKVAGRIGGAVIKKLPIIGALASLVWSGVEGQMAKEGEKTATTVSSLVSGLTLGVFSTDEVMDAFYSTSKVAEGLYAEQAASIKANVEAAMKALDPTFKHYQDMIKGAQKEIQVESDKIAMQLATKTKLINKKEQEALRAVQAANAAATQELAKGSAKLKQLKADQAEDLGGVTHALSMMHEQATDTFTNDVSISMKGMSIKAKHDFVAFINETAGFSAAEMEDGYLQVHNDAFDSIEEYDAIAKYAEILKGQQGKAHDATKKAMEKGNVALERLSVDSLSKALSAARKMGDLKGAAQYEAQLISKIRKNVGFGHTGARGSKSEFAKEIHQAMYAAYDAIGESTGLQDIKWGGIGSEIKSKYGVGGVYASKEAGVMGGAFSIDDLAKVDPEAALAIRNRMEQSVQDQLKGIADATKTDAEKQAEKIGELEAQKAALEKLKNLSGVPKQLEEMEKKFGGISAQALKEKVQAIMDKAVSVASSINDAIKSKAFKQYDATAAERGVKDLGGVAGTILPTAESLQSLVKGVQSIVSTVNTSAKFFASLNVKKLQKKMTTMVKKLLSLPAIIRAALSPLLPAQYSQEAIDHAAHHGIEVTEIEAIKDAMQKQADDSIVQQQIQHSLYQLTGFLGPIATSIGTASSAIKTLIAQSSAFPSLSKKQGTALANKISLGLGFANQFAQSMAAGSWSSLSNSNVGTKLDTATSNIKKMKLLVDNSKKLVSAGRKINPRDTHRLKTISGKIRGVVNDLAYAESVVRKRDLSMVKPVIEAIGAGGGKVEVIHSLPETKIVLNVSINARDFGNILKKVDLNGNARGTENFKTELTE